MGGRPREQRREGHVEQGHRGVEIAGVGFGAEDQQNAGGPDHGCGHGLTARRQQQRQKREGRDEQVLKTERAVLAFVVAGGAEGEIVRRAPGERIVEARVAEFGLGIQESRVEAARCRRGRAGCPS